MRIDGYSFGRLEAGGKAYTSDVIIYASRVSPGWWRKEGHLLRPEDLEGPVTEGVKTLVIGTGASGVMRVPEGTLRFLESKGIRARVMKTPEAVRLYNETPDDPDTAAALHLTC